jgi:hypothetical protein
MRKTRDKPRRRKRQEPLEALPHRIDTAALSRLRQARMTRMQASGQDEMRQALDDQAALARRARPDRQPRLRKRGPRTTI